MPMAPPISRPKEREMMKYSPPPSTFWLVAISARDMAVGMVTTWPIRMITTAPAKPTFPTTYPNRRNIIAPRMVEMAVRNTGAVPNPTFCLINRAVMRWSLY